MNTVAVEDMLSCEERLGITERVNFQGHRQVAGTVLIYPCGEEGSARPLADHPVLILPPDTHAGDTGIPGWHSPRSPSNLSCTAVSEMRRVPDFLRRYSTRTGTPVFASRFDASLLKSRIISVIREKGERQVMVHGVLVGLAGRGVLIIGGSGIGKTGCGLALVDLGAQWVADDAVVLERRDDAIYGRGHERTGHLIAVRGRGIVRADQWLGAQALCSETRVALIVHLERDSAKDGCGRLSDAILGMKLPCRYLLADAGPREMAAQVLALFKGVEADTLVAGTVVDGKGWRSFGPALPAAQGGGAVGGLSGAPFRRAGGDG
jgi:hypothetical protein